ncbi:HAD family hydrolase [[Eubacterium] cellulosolvens]
MILNNMDNTEIKLLVFDLDGVLVDTISSWVWVHNHFGVNNDVSHERYKRREIDDLEFMRSDIALWLQKKNRIHIKEIEEILSSVPIMPGFGTTMEALEHLGIQCAIVSSGLEPLARHMGQLGNFSQIFANGLVTDADGFLTGEGILNVKLRAKGEPVEQLISSQGFEIESTVAVGNAETDIPMFKACGMGIAFNPLTEKLATSADIVIYQKKLTEILKYVCDVNRLPNGIKKEL